MAKRSNTILIKSLILLVVAIMTEALIAIAGSLMICDRFGLYSVQLILWFFVGDEVGKIEIWKAVLYACLVSLLALIGCGGIMKLLPL
jgi:hypothetical protein